jgi:hypothetical protein
MKLTLIILNILGLIGAIIWLILKPDWEPLVTTIGLIGGLITQFYLTKDSSSIKMKQKGGKGSENYQSGGNITINKK